MRTEMEMSARLARIEGALERVLHGPERRPLPFTEELIEQFLLWSRSTQRNTEKWVGAQRRYLAWWRAELGEVDLRSVELKRDLLPPLDRARGGRAPRIAVIKRLYSYLRAVRHELTSAEDPTLGTLTVPQARPAQWRRPKHFTQAAFRRMRELLEDRWRDLVDVLAGTGWHLTELERFVVGGSIGRRPGKSSVLVCPLTKGGGALRTAVTPAVLAAGRRALKRGAFSEKWLRKAIAHACDEAGIERLTPGRFRHAVSTWAIDHGAAPAAVAAFLNHRSPRTTLRFYATHATAPRVPTLA